MNRVKSWFALLFLLTSAAAFGQSTGSISGRVVDPAGGVIPDATVTALNTATGLSRMATTNGDGLYNMAALEPAVYDIKVEKGGFASISQKGTTLVTGSTLNIDFQMTVASSTQQVEVTSEVAMVETTTSSVGGQLQTSEVQNLPMLNRNFSGMVDLIPGARVAPVVQSNKTIFGSGISVSGGSGRNVNVDVDGLDNRDNVNGGPMFNYTLEGIQEFNLLTHDYSAQYGRTNGGVVEITSKSGGNQLHGSAFVYGRSDALTAVDYFSDPAHGGLGKPPYDREQFGGSVGGPIKRNKVFFFGAYERVQQNFSLSFPASAYNESFILKNALIALAPTCPSCASVGNAIVPAQTVPQPVRDNQYTIKGDYHISEHNSLFVRWAQQIVDSTDDLIVIPGASSVPHPDVDPNGSNVQDRGRGYSIVGSETWLIGTNSVNTFAVQGNHLLTSETCNCGTPSPFWAIRNLQFPSIQVGRTQNASDQDFYETRVQFKDDFSHQMGKHALKFGGDVSFFPRIGLLLNGAGGNSQGAMTFFDNPDVILSNTAKYPQGFLTPGAVASITVGQYMQGAPPGSTNAVDAKQFGVYVQDDWKLTPRFTLNLGLRYDLDINFYNQTQIANNRTYLALKAVNSPFAAQLPQTPNRDLSPRVGFAWDIRGNGKDVVRASAGVFFDQIVVVTNYQAALQEKPTLLNQASTYTNSSVGVGTLGINNYVYGISALPPAPPVSLTQLPTGKSTSGFLLSPYITDPYNEQFHVGYTRQLTHSSVISTDYTHIVGLHDFRSQNINPVEGVWDPNAASYNTCGAPAGTRRLYCSFKNASALNSDPLILGGITLYNTQNRSQFNELDVHFEQRSRFVTFQASYVLAYAYDFGGNISGSIGGSSIASAMNPDLQFGPGEWGPTMTDERNRVILTGVFNLPKGIQISPVFQAASARPYNLTLGTDPTAAQAAAGICCRGDGVTTNDRYVNPATGQQVGVNAQRGEPTLNFDTRVTKFFSLRSETRKIGLFAEIYNITNRANFGNAFNGNASSGALFEKPTGYLAGGGAASAFPNSRQLQLGARFLF